MNRDSASASTTRPGASGRLDVARNVVVLASGETELLSLPHLVSHLQGTTVKVRIPPNNRSLIAVAESLIKSVWYEDTNNQPEKIILLVDLDGKSPAQVVDQLRTCLSARLPRVINMRVLYKYAQWHLEAWYFADATNLRAYLGRGPGSVDTSKPDEIENPKLHLKNLLPQVYTARVSAEIARKANPPTIMGRSPSFKGFVDAVTNGTDHGETCER